MSKRKQIRLQMAERKLVTSINPASIITEQFRTVRTNIKFAMPDKDVQTILFTSASPGEGKSTTAANVGIVFAQEGKKVLLIDSDMRKPSMHYTFQTSNSPGLSNILSKQWSVSDVIKKTFLEGLDIIPCGQLPSNPAELLSSPMLDTLIQAMKVKYDVIIFDAPPILTVSDAQILANKCDGTILVISMKKTKKESVSRAIEVLLTSKAKLLGTVLNNYKLKKDKNAYLYYRSFDID